MIRYIVREALINIKRSGTMSLVVIITMTITLLVFGVFLLLSANVSQALADLKDRRLIVAYLKDDLQEWKINEITSLISKMEKVKGITLVTKEEALAQFRKELGPQGFILDALETNPLPASLEIRSETDSSEGDISKLAAKIQGISCITSVDYSPKLVKVLNCLSLLLRVVILSLGIVFAIATLLIIFNTIKLVLFSRSREIEIMRLVGATDSFISWPYLLEGMIEGGIAGGVATITLWAIYELVLHKINELGFIPFGFNFLSWQQALIIVALGILLGLLGSFASVRYFLTRKGIVDEEG